MSDDGDDGDVVEWGMCVGGWVVYFGMFGERGFSHITVTAIVIRDCLKQSITVHIETKHCEWKAKIEFGATNRDTCDRYGLMYGDVSVHISKPDSSQVFQPLLPKCYSEATESEFLAAWQGDWREIHDRAGKVADRN